MYQVLRSNSNGKFTFKNSSFCRNEGNFDGVTSFIMTSWRHFDVTRPCPFDFSWSFKQVYQVSRSNAYGKFTFKNSLFCRGEDNFDDVTSLWRHDVILTSRDHVYSISRQVFIKCTKFQDRTLMGSLLLKIARFVVMKVILTAWRHYDVILTSRDHVHSISREVFIKCTKFQDLTLMGSLVLK